jgi:tetratricopeptide (TPR) repeat protein
MHTASYLKTGFLQAALWLLLVEVCYAGPRSGTTADPGVQARDSVTRYEDDVTALQSQYGASDPRLGEALLGLGLAYRGAGRHEDAAAAFKQSLHVIRMNDGLHSLVQLPYLKRLIEENTALGRWKEVNKNYNYQYWVYKRNYGDNDPRLLPVIDRITRSQIDIYNADPDAFTAANLGKRGKMLAKAVHIIETHYGKNDPSLVAVLNRVAMNQYYLALQTGSMHDYRSYKQYMQRARGEDLFTKISIPVPVSAGGMVVGVRYQEISVPKTHSPAYLSDHMARAFDDIDAARREGGLTLARIQAISEQDPQASVYARALAITHQGDWQLLYENGRGWNKYRQAYELLRQSADGTGYIDYLFGQPRPLPAMERENEDGPMPARDRAPAPGTFVEASFEVLPTGHSRHVQITQAPPGVNASVTRYIKWFISTMRFRPRLEDGQPVTTRDVSIKYVVDDHGRIMASVQ